MSDVFYNHVIVLDILIAKLDAHSINLQDKKKILSEVEKILHHEVLDEILSHLPEEHHTIFLETFHKTPADKKHMEFLRKYGHPDIEERLKKRALAVVNEVVQELMDNTS